jgi:hypothetical protein
VWESYVGVRFRNLPISAVMVQEHATAVLVRDAFIWLAEATKQVSTNETNKQTNVSSGSIVVY